MNSRFSFLFFIFCLLFGANQLFSQSATQERAPDTNPPHGEPNHRHFAGDESQAGKGPGTITVFSNGSFILIRGNQIIKFDRRLRFAGQTELPINSDSMKPGLPDHGDLVVAPFSEGDFVVLRGGKIFKYDSRLHLVQTTDIEEELKRNAATPPGSV